MKAKWTMMACIGLALPLLAACGEDLEVRTEAGAKGLLAGAEVTTWALIDHLDQPLQVGLDLPLEAVQKIDRAASLTLDLPATVRERTFFKQIVLDYRPPNGSLTGRFDVNFFGIDGSVRAGIDCSNEPLPSTSALPQRYAVPGGTCEPGRGVEAQTPETFSTGDAAPAAMVIGYHMGKLAAVEPRVNQSQLLQNKGFELIVPAVPDRLLDTYWPTYFKGSYRAQERVYRLVLGGFQEGPEPEGADF